MERSNTAQISAKKKIAHLSQYPPTSTRFTRNGHHLHTLCYSSADLFQQNWFIFRDLVVG